MDTSARNFVGLVLMSWLTFDTAWGSSCSSKTIFEANYWLLPPLVMGEPVHGNTPPVENNQMAPSEDGGHRQDVTPPSDNNQVTPNQDGGKDAVPKNEGPPTTRKKRETDRPPPPTGMLAVLIAKMLKSCCGSAVHLDLKTEYTNPKKMERNLGSEAFYFPIIRSPMLSSIVENIDNASFIPIAESQGATLIINEKNSENAIANSVFQTWPLFLMVVTASGIAGIIIWALDRFGNEDQFPKSFITGFWEGLWWAFVTMTTVGYGDKTPRSIAARIFSFLWIMIGLVLISIFTATLTTALTRQTSATSEISGKKIGVLIGTEEEILAIQSGADPVGFGSFISLMAALKFTKKIDGVLLDKFYTMHKRDEFEKDDLEVVGSVFNPTTYGVLAQGFTNQDISCFSRYVFMNRHLIYEDLNQDFAKLKHKRVGTAERVSKGLANDSLATLIVMTALLMGSIIFLLFWECLYWRPRYSKKKSVTPVISMKDESFMK